MGFVFVVPSRYIVENRLKAAEHGGKVCCIVLCNIVPSCDGPETTEHPTKDSESILC